MNNLRIRDKWLKDYGLSDDTRRFLIDFCTHAAPKDKEMIQKVCKSVKPELAQQLFDSLTLGISYDKLSAKEYIPLPKHDFYGYQRKALSLIDDYLRLFGRIQK